MTHNVPHQPLSACGPLSQRLYLADDNEVSAVCIQTYQSTELFTAEITKVGKCIVARKDYVRK
jgi:hypothetical protein